MTVPELIDKTRLVRDNLARSAGGDASCGTYVERLKTYASCFEPSEAHPLFLKEKIIPLGSLTTRFSRFLDGCLKLGNILDECADSF